MRKKRSRTATFLFSLLILWGVLSSQPQAVPPGALQESNKPTPIFHGESYSVLVDAVVTDRHNHLVPNLTATDFTVYEDGVPQRVESFQKVAPGIAPVKQPNDSEHREATEVLPLARHVRESATGPHYMVLMLDFATTELENQYYVRSAAKKYFREHHDADEEVAVVSVARGIRLLQNFTNDSDKILAALEHQDALGSSYAGDHANLQNAVKNSQAIQEQLSQQLNAALAGAVASANPRAGLAMALIAAELGAAQREELRTYVVQSFLNRQQSRPILDAIHAVADALAPLPGRKTLILISEGFAIPAVLESTLYSTVHAANRARMAIYAVDGKGLVVKAVSGDGELHTEIGALQTGKHSAIMFGESEFDRAREVGSDVQDSTLRYLASASGGIFIRHTNDFEGALGRIEQESRSYYLLSYRPINRVLDGQFRQIRVVVNKPNFEVRARSGYFAMPFEASLLSPEEFRQLTSLAGGFGAEDFPAYLEPLHFMGDDGTYTVELPVEVPLRGLTSQQVEGNAIFPLNVFGLIRDSHGDVVYDFRGPGPIRINLSRGQTADGRALMFTRQARLEPGTYAVDMAAVDRLSGHVSFRHASIQLDPVEKGLAVSSLVLSHHVEPATYGDHTIWKVGDMRVFPCAERRFRPDQDLVFYFNVYNPRVNAQTGQPDVEVNLSLVREGKPVGVEIPAFQLSQMEFKPSPHIQVARFIKIAQLPPGEYVLRAHVLDRSRGKTVSTQASFELVP